MADIQIPKTYKAAVYDKPGTISTKIETLETPEPGPGQVLINLTHSGVCHSDFGIMTSKWLHLPFPTKPGQVGGHEGVGKIVKMGPGTENSGVKVGQRVGVKWVADVCSSCPPCLSGYDGQCFAGKVSGYYTPGTFQQYVLGPAHYVTPIPDGVDSIQAAPMLCAGVTTYAALRKSNAQSGQWVVMLGAGGGLGHIACQIAARGMAMRVIGVDAAPKRQLVLDSGAEHFIALPAPGGNGGVKELTGGLGAHAVLVLTAANAAYGSACDMLRFGGTVVCVGVPEGEPMPVRGCVPQYMIARALHVVGVAVGNRREAIECLELCQRGVVKVHCRTEPLENLTKVFEEMHSQQLQGRVVMDLS
ncbi:chaperonin 10-like protein [Lineolata rhizophorae]|uniref:Chaperonin 10-like protein n=1 Tax=Lineolata rhizophorae TaxID=578093 RepID=A0A6A6PA72_9PEZI|nr:chaperonin 10-like protein [Lineolata rhizophorae]